MSIRSRRMSLWSRHKNASCPRRKGHDARSGALPAGCYCFCPGAAAELLLPPGCCYTSPAAPPPTASYHDASRSYVAIAPLQVFEIRVYKIPSAEPRKAFNVSYDTKPRWVAPDYNPPGGGTGPSWTKDTYNTSTELGDNVFTYDDHTDAPEIGTTPGKNWWHKTDASGLYSGGDESNGCTSADGCSQGDGVGDAMLSYRDPPAVIFLSPQLPPLPPGVQYYSPRVPPPPTSPSPLAPPSAPPIFPMPSTLYGDAIPNITSVMNSTIERFGVSAIKPNDNVIGAGPPGAVIIHNETILRAAADSVCCRDAEPVSRLHHGRHQA